MACSRSQIWFTARQDLNPGCLALKVCIFETCCQGRFKAEWRKRWPWIQILRPGSQTPDRKQERYSRACVQRSPDLKICWIQPRTKPSSPQVSLTTEVSADLPFYFFTPYFAWNIFLSFPPIMQFVSLSLGFLVKNKRDEAWNLIKEMAHVQRKQPGIIIQMAVSFYFWGKANGCSAAQWPLHHIVYTSCY